MKHTLLAAVIAGLAGSAALAGSPEPYVEHVYMPPIEVEPASTWEGFYFGGVGGFQSGEITPVLLEVDTTNYGAFAGYNFQSGNMVYGAEIAAQIGSADFTPGPTYDVNYMVDAKARVGYSMGDALLFASGGYTSVSIATPGPGFDASGWNAGAGLDYAVTDKFFLGGEYVYRSLPNTTPAGFDVTSHGAQLRAGFRF